MSGHSHPQDERLEDEHCRDADERGHEEVVLHVLLELHIPERFSFS